MWITSFLLCVPFAALLYGLLGPYHLATVASEFYTETHVGSYLVGPAQYYRAPAVVPGLDFESHYGIGHAYAFSLVMGDGLQPTLERYVLFVFVATVLYYLSALLVLTDWLRNPWAALAVTLAVVLSCCESLSYTYPSNWPVRHPFLFVLLFAMVRGTHRPSWCAVAGAVAGLSLFWQTDIGLYTLAAGTAFYGANWLFLGGSWSRPAVFLAVAVGSFFTICTALFGPRVLSFTFAERLLEPLLLYANGFGTVLMNWSPGWSYWFNLAGPGIAVASVGVMLGYGRRTRAPREVLYAAAASLVGLAILYKWVNRSYDVLWPLNGNLLVAVAGSWMWAAWRAIVARLEDGASPRVAMIRRTTAAVALIGLAILAVRFDARKASSNHIHGNTSPVVRLRHWLNKYRHPINAARWGLEPLWRASPVSEDEARFLRDHTAPTDRVAIISGCEWSYHADIGRAPRLHWLQLYFVHSPILLDRCADDLRHTDQVFVDRILYPDLKQVNPTAFATVASILDELFERVDSSPRWDLYRRKPGPTAGR